MPEHTSEVLRELAAELAADVARRYRIDSQKAVELILEEWGRNPKLLAAVDKAGSAELTQRTRVYRDAATATKKTIYNKLRAYRAEPIAFDTAVANLRGLPAQAAPEEVDALALTIAEAHVSTAERLAHGDMFLDVLDRASAGARAVVDVGSGVLPALIGAGWLTVRGIEPYWAVDKDAKAVAALAAYAERLPKGLLRPQLWNIAEGWDVLHRNGLPEECDVAWLLKVVPVVARQQAKLLPVLAATPARRLLVSGSRVAMAKRQNIEARERRVVRRFCDDHGFRQIDEYRTEDEFFVLVERE